MDVSDAYMFVPIHTGWLIVELCQRLPVGRDVALSHFIITASSFLLEKCLTHHTQAHTPSH